MLTEVTAGAVYPGTFDPLTYGHLDIIERSARLFPRVIVAVADNALKRPFFSLEERIAFIQESTQHLPNVGVRGFKVLLTTLLQELKLRVVIRGLRTATDFDYENQLTSINQKLLPDFESVFLMPAEPLRTISSTLVKELVLLGAEVGQFVPPVVAEAFTQKAGDR